MVTKAARRNSFQASGSPEAEAIAHVFRRCSFGPRHGDVARWVDRGPAALIDALLANDDIHVLEEQNLFDAFGGSDELDDEAVFDTFVDQMFTGSNPLHERMTWYWHTHFTSSVESSEVQFGWQQHHLIRRNALGNFHDLARAITTDPAMLFYLDGTGSYGENPNENYAREFLELFALGRNAGYTEADVRAAARILSGWHVDWETGRVDFDPDSHYERPVTFMGKRQRWTVDKFIEFVCALPQCHQHVATRLYHHFVGPDLSEDRRNELASVFGANLDIRALVGEMLRGNDFLQAMHSRARQPLEWALGALNALGYTSPRQVELKNWHLQMLGQMPMLPPNVAGWPLDDRWASTSQIIARTSLLLEWELAETTINSVPPTVDAVLERCGIFDPSPSTRAALDEIERTYSEFDYRLELLFVTALTSPEFTLL